MLMFKHLNDWEKRSRMIFWQEDGNEYGEEISADKTVTGFKIVKTRRGNGKDKLYGVQTSLDLNRWKHIGEVIEIGDDWS